MSSTLQLGLAVAGGLVLAGVIAHSTWSSRRNRPKQASAVVPPGTETDAPEAAETRQDIEPTLDDNGVAVVRERQEPSFDASMASLTAMTQVEKRPGLDALIDVIAPILVENVVSGEAALAALPPTRRVGSKPFAVEGLSVENGDWETPAPGRRYSAFQAGVQLANRTGALNQIEFSEYVMKAQAFADAIGGEPEFPDMLEEVARARELDHFASGHDAQLSFTLRAVSTAWSPGYLHQSAARAGFVPGAIPGRMVLPGTRQGDAPMLGLSFDTQAAMADEPEQTALRELVMSLDVPQVPRGDLPFARLCEAALALASSMDGVIIDDNGNLIRVEAMEVINTDLEQLYDTLDGRDLSAGSQLARRLFS
ncbi:MAG: cell division protein FtsZ [Comamonadaceae bacterium]|nr:MAG: cell division protein FtsZ [Comamonadaceae bacterium]